MRPKAPFQWAFAPRAKRNQNPPRARRFIINSLVGEKKKMVLLGAAYI